MSGVYGIENVSDWFECHMMGAASGHDIFHYILQSSVPRTPWLPLQSSCLANMHPPVRLEASMEQSSKDSQKYPYASNFAFNIFS